MSSNLQIFQSWLYKEYSDDVPNDIIDFINKYIDRDKVFNKALS